MKRKIFSISVLASLATMFWGTGCTDSFDKVNSDPDRTNEAPISNILAYSIRYATDNLFDVWNDMNEPSTYGGHLTKIQYTEEPRYIFRTGVVENKWYYIYITYNNVKDIENRSKAEGLVNMESVAKVWGTMLISMATDTWRDVPYSQAARMSEGILLPGYDKQEDIYPAMLETLASAADGFASGATDDLGGGDILFDGDVKKWQQYCNSMRLRLAMRISDIDAGRAKAVVEEILGNPTKYPVLEVNDDNAFFNWPGEAPYIEPWADDSRSRDDHGVSDVLVNLMKSLDDPRLPVYAHPTKPFEDPKESYPGGEYNGGVIGASEMSDIRKISRIGARFRDDYKGFTPYFRAAETFFHIAEASKLGWNTGTTTKAAYETAVALSLEENGIKDPAAYLAGKAKFNDTFEQIYQQEWISLFKQGMEAWSLYRRTGVPATHYFAPGSPYVGHNSPPFRYPYPINESSLNGANLKPFKDEVVDDFWGKPMWWDTRKGVQ